MKVVNKITVWKDTPFYYLAETGKKIQVDSVGSKDYIALRVGKKEYLVLADELKRAVDNALNTGN